MAADLHIHIRTPEVTDQVMKAFMGDEIPGTGFYAVSDHDAWNEACLVIDETPNVHVGEVSWLKAALFGDAEAFIPGTVMKVSEAIGDGCEVDDALIAKVRAAYELPNTTGYELTSVEKVLEFLEEHKGKRCFTISW